MTTLTDKFTALEEQMNTEHAATQVDLDDIRVQLANMESWLNEIRFAVEGGNRAILGALSSIDPCVDCGDKTIAVPPIAGITSPIDEDKCKRVQAFLHTMEQFFTVLDTASAFSVPFNLSLVTSAVNQVIAGLDSGDAVPAISFPEATMLVGDLVVFVANNLLEGRTLSGDFGSVIATLTSAMYLTSSVEAAKNAYSSTILGAGLPAWSATVLVDTAYNDVFKFYFDPESEPNLTGYDGDVCVGGLLDITTCTDFASAIHHTDGVDWSALVVPVFDNDTMMIAGDFFGWTFQIIEEVSGASENLRFLDMSDNNLLAHALNVAYGPYTFVAHTHGIALYSNGHTENAFPFVVRVCPPEE